jgi:hypothetical protein
MSISQNELEHCGNCGHCRFAHGPKGYCEETIRRFGETDTCDCLGFTSKLDQAIERAAVKVASEIRENRARSLDEIRAW